MVIKNVVRGIGLVLVMINVIWMVMAATPTITYDAQTPDNGTILVDYINVSVSLSSAGGMAILNWDGDNDTNPMTGSGNSFYTNKSSLLNGSTHTFFVYANDTTPSNWYVSNTRIVTINLPSIPLTIISSNPLSTVTTFVGSIQEFNITLNQIATINWIIDGVLYPANTTMATLSSYNNSSAGIGVYIVKANATNSNGSVERTWTWNVTNAPDLTPPASITGLTMVGNGTSWINWSWTNPNDADFAGVRVYIDSLYKGSFTTQYYNATGLSSGTSHNISTQTVDNSSNINSTWVNLTNSTLPNTQTGSQVNVTLQNSTVTFATVTVAGNTVETPNSTKTLPSGYTAVGYYIDISTTATYTAPITLRVKYTSLPSGYTASDVRLYHWNDSTNQWDNVTTSVNGGTSEVIGTVSSLSPFVSGVPSKPSITKDSPTGINVETIGSQSATFKAHSDQTANITWRIDTVLVFDNGSVASGAISTYTNTIPTTGLHNVTVTATNANGSSLTYWNWTVRPKTYATGNRVWDGGKQDEYSLNYIWDPLSFYAFYYDLDTGVGNEALEITLLRYDNRNIKEGALKYSTKPYSVSFEQEKWGNYSVIGFMADKYFAGYTSETKSDITSDPVSPLNSNQLHKILMDDKTQRVVSAGSTLTLQEGYVIKIKDVDATGRIVLLSLLKDGSEIDTQPVSQGGTYVYAKKVGAVRDLPIIAIRVDNVFSGKETSAAFTKGMFQISESYTSAKSDNRYGIMEITTASASGIEMENSNSFTLSQGSTIDIMGDMKFIVADNSSVLRFAPMVKRSGTYEVRGTIAQDNDTSFEWTPMNFEGFYYNIDDDVGTEKLSINRSGTSVPKETLIYTSTPQPVSYKYSKFGTFKVIGFMADTYFAGYIGCGTCITSKDISTIGSQQLHRVLVDDDTQRVIYAGSTLTLNDGYVLKIKDVNIGAGAASVWLSLLKDGSEIYEDVKNEGEIFTYAPSKVGAINDLPIIALRIDKIFRGTEATAAFTKGVFQISEKYTSVKQGDRFGIMEVSEVSNNKIQMDNPSSFTLSSASIIDVMGNIKFKVADSSEVRFYPFIMANGTALSANQLSISVPSSMMVKDTITIGVTSGAGTPEGNAEVSFDGEVIGTTNSTGNLDYLLTRAGQHNFSATKLGYEKATKAVKIDEYVDNRLNFELPEFIDQYIPVSIKVKVSGTGNAIPGANITFDGKSIGTTDSNGILTYTFTESGTHNLAASKPGYIAVQREINVRLPFIEFKASDINFRPDIVNKGQNVYVWANITNTGTKEGMLSVALIINDTVVENSNVTLAPGKNSEVNFSHKVELPPGNYTVEILGQKTTMPVKEEPLNLFLIAGIITILGAVSIFIMTSKEIISIEAIKAKLNMGPATGKAIINRAAIDKAINNLRSKFQKN